MADVQWIKLYIDTFDKRKIKKVRRLPAGNDLLLIWIMLLAMAGKCNAGGMIYITESVPFTEEDLADELDFEIGTIKLALQAFENLNMITTSDDGFIEVIGWEEYQNVDKLAELRAKDRERKRLKKAQARAALPEASNSTEIPRNSNGNSTDVPPIEEEEELEKEKEIHSFNHSIAQGEDDYIEDCIKAEGFEGKDADLYREHLREKLKLKYIGGTLGQGVVLMSDEQFGDLCERLSIDELHKYFKIVVDCEKQGKCYTKKTHYQAILEMAMKDRAIKMKGI